MLQPFERFKPVHLQRLIALKKRWLVTQTYERGVNHISTAAAIELLLTDYSDHGLAKIHYNAVRHDKYATILDLDKEIHRKKIAELMNGTVYKLYWAVVESRKKLEDLINKVYKDNMRRYIDNKTNWSLDRNVTLYPTIQMTFGELFIILKHGSQTLRIKFEEIEAM